MLANASLVRHHTARSTLNYAILLLGRRLGALATSIVRLNLSWVGLPVRQTVIPLFRHDLADQGERTAWTNILVARRTFNYQTAESVDT